jgi:cytochrome c-type biogenesis protein CcmH/NrfG
MMTRVALAVLLLCTCFASPVTADGGGGTKASSRSSDYRNAVKAIKKQDYSSAVDLLEQVVAKNPDDADAWNQMGFSLRNMQQFEDAFAAYEKALEIDPKHKGALEYLGELYLMTGQPGMAKAQLEKLDAACFLSCRELRLLKKRIAAYEGGP